MLHIRPITDLRNTNEISELCHQSGEPIFITKNGHGDLVIMSIETYEKKLAQADTKSKHTKTAPSISPGLQEAE